MSQELISVIITIFNGAKWIDICFESILRQTAGSLHKHQTAATHTVPPASLKAATEPQNGVNANFVGAGEGRARLEICVFDDASTDDTMAKLCEWRDRFGSVGVQMLITANQSGRPKGVGHGRNQAIATSQGAYLCFQDVDDEMLPERVQRQYAAAVLHPRAIIGCKFTRIPANSMCRFTRWANSLSPAQLQSQVYTSNGPTVIMPTWFCSRRVYEAVPGGFCEDGHGTPEDLIFFYKHLDGGGEVVRVDEYLLRYRYHPDATTFSIAADTIWRLRMQHLIVNVLARPPWCHGFTIWNAGKQGRRFFRDLPRAIQHNVRAMCDVDKNKINKFYQYFDETSRRIAYAIPIVHFAKAETPLVICMKLDLTNGGFEANLKSLNLTEGKDYVLFS